MVVGGFTEFRIVTEEDLSVLTKALEGWAGSKIEPLAVATQVVAGINYKFFCNITPVVPNATSHPGFVNVYLDLNDNAKITGIEDL